MQERRERLQRDAWLDGHVATRSVDVEQSRESVEAELDVLRDRQARERVSRTDAADALAAFARFGHEPDNLILGSRVGDEVRTTILAPGPVSPDPCRHATSVSTAVTSRVP